MIFASSSENACPMQRRGPPPKPTSAYGRGPMLLARRSEAIGIEALGIAEDVGHPMRHPGRVDDERAGRKRMSVELDGLGDTALAEADRRPQPLDFLQREIELVERAQCSRRSGPSPTTRRCSATRRACTPG